MAIHAALKCMDDIILKCICCHCDDRQLAGIVCSDLPDRPCRVISVHDRHLDIHKDQPIVAIRVLPHLPDGLLPVFGCLDHKSGL